MEQREGGDSPPKKPPAQTEASSTAPADFPAKKLVRQLDFTGLSDSAAASTVEQPQLANSSQPAPRQPQLPKPAQPHPSQMVFMTVQQPPQPVVPPTHPSLRPIVKPESPRARLRQNVNDVKDGTPKKQKQCNCKHSRCLKLYCECFASGTYCDGCNCVNCHNNVENEAARREAVEAILERNPNAFRPEIASSPHGVRDTRMNMMHIQQAANAAITGAIGSSGFGSPQVSKKRKGQELFFGSTMKDSAHRLGQVQQLSVTCISTVRHLPTTTKTMSNINSNDYNESFDVEEGDHTTSMDLSENQETSNVKPDGKRKRQQRSKWWQYFDLLPPTEGGPLKCACKACGHVLGADSKNGKGNMRRHLLERCPRMHSRDIGQALLEKSNAGLGVRSQKFDQERFRELLILAIIKHELPFQFVEYEAIRSIFAYLEPQVVHFTRNTARADIVKLHKNELSRLGQELRASPGRICFTCDLWTSITTDGYLCLTAHYIDADWVLQKKIINFSFMPPPHSGIALCDKICGLLGDWDLDKKVFTVTLDNASANDVFIENLKDRLSLKSTLVCHGEFLHVRCCCHIMNIIVQEGLKYVDESVVKIRECVKYAKGSQAQKQKFLESVKQCSLDSKRGLRQDVPTRWNSTYLMLSSALYYRLAFSHLRLTDSNFKYCPTSDEWVKIEKLCTFLKVFYDASNLFAGVRYPTANLYFPVVFKIEVTLHRELSGEDEFMRNMAAQMFKKFGKYWDDYSTLFAIALVFDPRFKLDFIEFSYKKLYGTNNTQFEGMKEKLFSMFDEYVSSSSSSKTTTSASSSSGSHPTDSSVDRSATSGNNYMDILREFCFDYATFQSSAHKNELQLYLGEQRMDPLKSLDVLDYWKLHGCRYPVVAKMARDVLSVPISSVASESAFSTGGRILDQYRNAMKPDVVEALICCNDWLFGPRDDEAMKLDDLTENVLGIFLNAESSASETSPHLSVL